MAITVEALYCKGCQASVSVDTKFCEYCGSPVVISTFNSVASLSLPEVNKMANGYMRDLAKQPEDQQLNMSIAFCYLKLKLYDKALPYFEKAIEDNFDNSEVYFYAAVALLQGKKAFVTPRKTIDKIIEYLQAALMIEPRGIYHYFLAYIKCDFFARKFLNTTPNFKQCLQDAKNAGLSEYDVSQLYALLNVERPSGL